MFLDLHKGLGNQLLQGWWEGTRDEIFGDISAFVLDDSFQMHAWTLQLTRAGCTLPAMRFCGSYSFQRTTTSLVQSLTV